MGLRHLVKPEAFSISSASDLSESGSAHETPAFLDFRRGAFRLDGLTETEKRRHDLESRNPLSRGQ
jgi:hypothetical protein